MNHTRLPLRHSTAACGDLSVARCGRHVDVEKHIGRTTCRSATGAVMIVAFSMGLPYKPRLDFTRDEQP